MAGMMSRGIIDMLSKRGQPPSQQPGGGVSGAQPAEAGANTLGARMAELGGSDPGALVKSLEQMKKNVVDLIPQTAFRLPGVTKHLVPLLKALDGAIKEAQQGLSTQQTVEQSPIGLSIAQPGGAPGEAGPAAPPAGGGGAMPLAGGMPGGMV
jgi:hypothetical protein